MVQLLMQLDMYQIDAFTDRVFTGNPAAVVPLQAWLPEQTMQGIALENNLSETAFFVPENDGYKIRWFTPNKEVDLCGHATLATAYVIFNYLETAASAIKFSSNSGPLQASKQDRYIQLDFPAIAAETEADTAAYKIITEASNQAAQAVYSSIQDYLVILDSEQAVQALSPDLRALMQLDGRGVIFTAQGDDCDFVSRCFFPKYDVDEDPVTGSAHCVSAPYWGKTLNKTQLHAKQLSQRGGEVICKLVSDRVLLLGKAVPFMKGTITL